MTHRSRYPAQVISAALFLGVIGGTVARAQEQVGEHLLPPVTVRPPRRVLGPGNSQAEGSGSGTNDKQGDSKQRAGTPFDQLNRDLKRKVDETNPTVNAPPLNAASPDTKTGVVNIPAVQQQYGKNFGQSAVPYRPPPPVYTLPLGRR